MRKIIAASVVCAGLVSPVFAHDSSDDNQNVILVTASRIPLEPREIGSALSVVTRETLQEEQVIFVKDALQALAGVQISSDRPGDFTNVSIRGSDNDQVLWLIDGIKLGDPSSTSTQYQPDHLTAADIGQIEVLRGNQSSLYGSDAIGGVINIITQRATQEGIKASAEAEVGSYGTASAGASILGKSGPLDFRLTATGYTHDGPSLADPKTARPAGSVTEDDGYGRYGFSGRLGLAATDTLNVQLIGLWQDVDSDTDDSFSDNSGHIRKKDYAGAVQANYLSLDRAFKADASVSRYVSRRLFFGQYYAPEGDVYKGIKDAATFNVGYNAGVWGIAAGVNWEKEKTDQVTNYSGDFHAQIETKSAYGELALRPVEDLTITGAARVDDNSRFGTFDTYRGTMAYMVPGFMGANSLKLRASYGTGAKAPGLYQLFDPSYGNPRLKVETSRGGDIGFDLDFDQFSAQLSYFFGKTKNEIVFDNAILPYGGYGQFGRTRKQGMELAFIAKPVDGLSIQQTFTYLDAQKDPLENGRYVTLGRPKTSGSTSVTVMPAETLSLTARARYRSLNRSSYGGATAAYAVFDVLGSLRISEMVEIYGRVQNLFDKDYQMTYGVQTLGRAGYAGVRIGF